MELNIQFRLYSMTTFSPRGFAFTPEYLLVLLFPFDTTPAIKEVQCFMASASLPLRVVNDVISCSVKGRGGTRALCSPSRKIFESLARFEGRPIYQDRPGCHQQASSGTESCLGRNIKSVIIAFVKAFSKILIHYFIAQ